MNKILIVEDEFAHSSLLKKEFEKAGYMVMCVSNGEDAMKSLAEEIPDIVLMDILMPKKDGITTVREIRANEKTKELPVLFLTNVSDEAVIFESFKGLNINGYMLKSDSEITEVVAKANGILDEIRGKGVLLK